MKLLVETTGPFQLVTLGEIIRHNRPSVVRPDNFIDHHTGAGRLKVLGQLRDDAADAAFVDTLEQSKGDVVLATAAFLSEYGLDAEPPPKPAKKAKAPATSAE